LANLRIGQKLDEALSDLEKKTNEAQEAKRNISSILELLPVGLVAIDQNGIIQPGHSKSTKSIVGIEDSADITGTFLADFIRVESSIGQSWKNWLNLVYSKFGLIPFKDLITFCNLNEIKNSRDRILKLDWLAITKDNPDILDKLLVVIEDVTKQRELEAKMEDLSKRHQENLELISQIINLSPDEVTNFIYDSSQLLADAQKIVEGNNRDREILNDLFRTFHTLKGSSGQYQFKSMQDMAHKVEDYLRDYRDDSEIVDDCIIDEVKSSIASAKSYLNRIQDIRTKLGGKD
jgi:HPt (histidine-containing phosphotransfer) domain-containing protein